MKLRVLFSTHLLEAGFSDLKEYFDVCIPEKESFTKADVLELISGFDAFIPTFQFKVDKDIIDAGKDRLKIIANYGVGYNNIDVDYATKCGIVVTNTPDPVIEPTAEFTMALLLASARRITECDRKLRIPNGLKWGVMQNLGNTLSGKTVGIIGMGRIGQAFAGRALAFGMKIVYYNRHRLSLELETKYKTERLELNDLLKNSDVVSIHTPMTDETYHLISTDEFKIMKSSSILVNTSRGPVIDEVALIEALRNKEIHSVALDVFENEPFISEELFRFENVVISPHNGSATFEARIEMNLFVSQNIIRFFEGRDDISKVN